MKKTEGPKRSNQRLRERTDEAGLMSKEIVNGMIEKIYALAEIRSNIMRERREEINKVKLEYLKKLNIIDADIYKFENSIKKLAGASEYHFFKSKYREKILQEKKKLRDEEKRQKLEVKLNERSLQDNDEDYSEQLQQEQSRSNTRVVEEADQSVQEESDEERSN